VFLVMSFRPRLSYLTALAAAGALAFGLAGCGVKGPLEPPPASGIEDRSPTAERPSNLGAAPSGSTAANMIVRPVGGAGIASGTTSSAVTQAPTAQQPSVLDWLIK
jgi:predicted small lipoprotein YifL